MQSSTAYWNVGTKPLYPYLMFQRAGGTEQSRAEQENLRCVHKLPLVELEGSCLPPASPGYHSTRPSHLIDVHFSPIASPSITSSSTGRTQIRPAPRRLESRGHGRRRLVAATVTVEVLSCPSCPHLRRAPFSLDLPLVCFGGGEAPIQASSH